MQDNNYAINRSKSRKTRKLAKHNLAVAASEAPILKHIIIIVISQVSDIDAREPWLDLSINMNESTKKVMGSSDRGIMRSVYSLSIACNPDIFNGLLTVTTLHLAYLDRKETPVVLDTGRRRPISNDILPFHRNVWVAGQESSERVTTKTSSKGLSSISRRSHRKTDLNHKMALIEEKIISRDS